MAEAKKKRSPAAAAKAMFPAATLRTMATAADEEIKVGDDVVALAPLVSLTPPPPVVVPATSRGEVVTKEEVGSSTGYEVEFDLPAGSRVALAFAGQIRKA